MKNNVQLVCVSTGHDDGHFAASGKVEAAHVLASWTSLGIDDEPHISVFSLQLNCGLERRDVGIDAAETCLQRSQSIGTQARVRTQSILDLIAIVNEIDLSKHRH